jgi:hypothetical protein
MYERTEVGVVFAAVTVTANDAVLSLVVGVAAAPPVDEDV